MKTNIQIGDYFWRGICRYKLASDNLGKDGCFKALTEFGGTVNFNSLQGCQRSLSQKPFEAEQETNP